MPITSRTYFPNWEKKKIEECGFEELMLKILDNKYKIQTFFDQVAEILDKEEENFIERIRFKSTTEFIQQMDKYILYLEQNAFRPTDLKSRTYPYPCRVPEKTFRGMAPPAHAQPFPTNGRRNLPAN